MAVIVVCLLLYFKYLDILGFAKVIALEYPELHCVRIDCDAESLTSAKCLLAEILNEDREDEIGIVDGQQS